MKKISILSLLAIFIAFTSCKKETLQTYLLAKKDDPNFITLDVSSSILPISLNAKATAEDKKAFESIRKINVAFLQSNKVEKPMLIAEKEKLTTILKKSNYKTLMSFKDKRGTARLYYLGETDAINEMVGFVYSDNFGTGVARLLGKNMNPDALIKMMKNIDADENSDKIKNFKTIIEAGIKNNK